MNNPTIWRQMHDAILAALRHFRRAPEPMELPPICGMTVEDIAGAIFASDEWKLNSNIPSHFAAARIAHRLAQPVPKVDPDAGARAMCDDWAIKMNNQPGPLRDLVPTFDAGNDEWKQRWRDHYNWVLSGFPKTPTWAVAKEGGQ